MADVVEKMLAGTQTTFHGDNRHLVAETSRMDDIVERSPCSGHAGARPGDRL